MSKESNHKPQRIFSISKSYQEVHEILDSINSQERSRFICDAILMLHEKKNNPNWFVEEMQKMFPMFQQIIAMQQMMQPMMQQPVAANPQMQQPMQTSVANPMQMMMQSTAAQVAASQQVSSEMSSLQHTELDTVGKPTSLTEDTERLTKPEIEDKIDLEEATSTDNDEFVALSSQKPQNLSRVEPQKTVNSNPAVNESTQATAQSQPPKDEGASTELNHALKHRRRGGMTKQFM